MLSENQFTEIDALQCIFPDSDVCITENGFQAVILPYSDLVKDLNPSGLKINVVLPPGYPDVGKPIVETIWRKNIDQATWLDIKNIIEDTTDRNLGQETLFDLVSNIQVRLPHFAPIQNQEFLRSKAGSHPNAPCEQHSEQEHEIDLAPKGLADKDLVPEDVRATDSQFEAWAAAFRKEMISAGIWKDENTAVRSGKPTGRELFLRGSLQAQEVEPDTSAAIFWQNEHLFADDDLDG